MIVDTFHIGLFDDHASSIISIQLLLKLDLKNVSKLKGEIENIILSKRSYG